MTRRAALVALVALAACSTGGDDAGPATTTPATVRLGTGTPPPEVLTEVRLAGEVSSVATLDGRLFAVGGQLVDGPGGRYARDVRELDPTTGEIERLAEIDAPVDRIVAGHGRLWAVGRGSLVVVDPGTLTGERLPVVADAVALDGSGAWVVARADHELVRLDREGAVVRRVPLPDVPQEVVATGGVALVRLRTGTLARVGVDGAVTTERWLGGRLLADAGDGWIWTEDGDDLVARRGEKTRERIAGVGAWAVAPDGDGGLVVGGARLFGRVTPSGAPDVRSHGSAEVWSVTSVDGVAWGATLGGRLLRLGAPSPPVLTRPVFVVEPARAPAGAVVTVRGWGLEPSHDARPLRFVRTGVKPRKVGEAVVRPSGSFAYGLHVDGDLTPGAHHVAFDQRRAGDVEVVRADLGVPYRVAVDVPGCLRFDLRTWAVPAGVTGGRLTLTGAEHGVLDGVPVAVEPCG